MSNFNQLCVLQGVCLEDTSIEDFVKLFKDEFNVSVKFAEEVITNPDLDENGNPIPDTGGRHDILFWVADEDVSSFAIKRFSYGIRWWEDVVFYNDGAYLYSKEVLDKYPIRW